MSEPTSEPTIKASLASAALGCTLLNKLVQNLTDEQIEDIVDYNEVVRLDKAIWSLFEYTKNQRADGIGQAQAFLQAHSDNEPDMDAVNESLKAIEEGRTRPIDEVIKGLSAAELLAKGDQQNMMEGRRRALRLGLT